MGEECAENLPKILKIGPNKKWAVSPLISPPAGALTATQADKLVCILSIRPNPAKFNGQVSRTADFHKV
jgi:hypothetical protein